ncbi:hypothetical protein BE15_32650 [Sorangium cellulosum]|uniref:Uncharacterized protein n=1 Tax=Sorangium cellulosum TaxID=56 RepID=A0A150Q0B5_SORCE|nr:hypothetical protein BE15_32650 [Sorangium cellulosum]
MHLDPGERQEQPAIEVLGEHPGHEQRRHVARLDSADGERLSGPVSGDVVDPVVVHGDERDALLRGHRLVAGPLREVLPELVRVAAPLGDRDLRVPARLEALHDAAHELRLGDPAGHAVVALVLRRVLHAVEPADVRLEEHGGRRGPPGHHRLAEALAELQGALAAQHGDR